MNDKGFDCLAFKERVQAEIYEEIKDLSPEQEVEYFRKSVETGPFAEWWKKVREEGARRRGAKDPAA
jgi:hypothetical protein